MKCMQVQQQIPTTDGLLKQPVNKMAAISQDRKRTNLLRGLEQPALLWLCNIMPKWVTPNMLTGLGLAGSVIVFAGFWLARTNVNFMWLAVAGWFINWLGDSLDGRIAYFRNIPRKWYGFTLDMCMDWISTFIVALGFYYYLPADYRVLAFSYMATYGWSFVMALLKYKLTNKYVIDTGGIVGPTELRVAICLVLLLEVAMPGSIKVFAVVVNILMLIVNLISFNDVLNTGDQEDKRAKMASTQQ